MNTQELEDRINEVCLSYMGNAEKLRNAIGVAYLCQQFGWRTVKLIHATRAWKLYKQILGIDFESEFPEETQLAERFVAYKVWKATGRYWDTLRNKVVPPKNKRDIDGVPL